MDFISAPSPPAAHGPLLPLRAMEQEGALVSAIYYGRISSEATEQLLQMFGRDGTFLLRDSETVQGAYCLCVRKTPFVHTYRLLHSSSGWSLQDPRFSNRTFQKLETLIETYQRGPRTERNIVPLTDPLDKTQLPYFSFGPGRTSRLQPLSM